MTASSRRVAYLVKSFPKLSETFILGEVLGLEARGVPLLIVALQHSGDNVQHAHNARVRSPIVRLRERNQSTTALRLKDHIACLIGQPRRYLAAAARCACRSEGGRWRDFALACTLARQLQLLGIKHVHAHFASQPAAIADIATKMIGGTFSISAHAKDIYTSEPVALSQRMSRAEFVVTCTKHNVDYLREIAASTNLHLMYHGIDATKFSPAPSSLATPPLILSVGRLREKKGFATLIEACASLRDRGIAFCCEIVGYGEQESALLQKIEDLKLQQYVTLVGALDHTALIERYRAAAIFAAPSLVAADGDRDGIPNVLLEAMAMELPVVSTPVSGIPEVITHGVNGVLVPPGRAVELAECLNRLLRDAPLRQHLGRAARAVVIERFDNQRNLDVIQQLLQRRGPESASRAITEHNHHAQHHCCAQIHGAPE